MHGRFGRQSAGTLRVFDQDPLRLNDAQLARLAYVPQEDLPFPELTAREYMRYLAGFYESFDGTFALSLLKRWETPTNSTLQQLSLGQRQRVEVARALAAQPELLLLDEPLSGVDPLARRQIIEELLSFAHGRDSAVVFTTHILSDIEQLSVDLALLREGRIQFRESISALKQRYVLLRQPWPESQPVPTFDLASAVRRSARGELVLLWERARFCAEDPSLSGFEASTPSLEDLFVELGG